VEFLGLGAMVVVSLGFLWRLALLVLVRSQKDRTWLHVGISAGLCAASAGLIAYMITHP
jgi:hypothetical protein